MNKKLFLLLSVLVIIVMVTGCGGAAQQAAQDAQKAAEAAKEQADKAADEAQKAADEVKEQADKAVEEAQKAAEEVKDQAEQAVDAAKDAAGAAMAANIKPIKIALILPSTINDLAWSQSIYQSLKQIQDEAGKDKVELVYTENMFKVPDAAAAIRDYASNGYGLIIAHGAQYGDSLFEIAPDFPETSFAWGTTTNTGADKGVKNVFAYEPRGDEGGYVSGVLAAKLTKAKVIGLVGPVDAGDAKLHVDGFVAGVKATDPSIKVNVSFTGSFGDTALAAEAANTHVNAGADVLTGSSQQVVGAIGVAKDKNIPWIGIQADQSPVAPEAVVATALYDWHGLLLEMIAMHQAGEMGGKVLQLTLKNGGIRMIYSDKLPQEAVDAANQAQAGLVDGSIKIVAEPR
jgi:basic membrane protein A